MVGHNETVRKLCTKLRHFCARQKGTEEGEGAGPVCREGNNKPLGWLQRSSLRCSKRTSGNGGGGEAKGEVPVAAGEQSTEMVMLSNPSFRDASRDSKGGAGENEEKGRKVLGTTEAVVNEGGGGRGRVGVGGGAWGGGASEAGLRGREAQPWRSRILILANAG